MQICSHTEKESQKKKNLLENGRGTDKEEAGLGFYVRSKKLSPSTASYILPSPVSLCSPSPVHRVIALSDPSYFPFSLKSTFYLNQNLTISKLFDLNDIMYNLAEELLLLITFNTLFPKSHC